MKRSEMKKQIKELDNRLLKLSISNSKKQMKMSEKEYKNRLKRTAKDARKDFKESMKYPIMSMKLAKEELARRKSKRKKK